MRTRLLVCWALADRPEVVEWDTARHEEGIQLWYKAIMADGGKGCQDTCAIIGEPLIQGMVIGEEKDFLDIPARQEVRLFVPFDF